MRKIYLFILLATFFTASAVNATPITLAETGHGDFNRVEIFSWNNTSPIGGIFLDPGMTNFSNGSWTNQQINSGYITASGPLIASTSVFSWDMNVALGATTLYFDEYFFKDGTLSFTKQLRYNGLAWSSSYNALSNATYLNENREPDQSPVPEPATIFLLGSGLAGIIAKKRKSIMGIMSAQKS